MDHVSEDGPKETAARDELIIHPILRQGAQFASLMTTTFPFRKTPGEDPVKLHASGAGGLSYCEKVIRTRGAHKDTIYHLPAGASMADRCHAAGLGGRLAGRRVRTRIV